MTGRRPYPNVLRSGTLWRAHYPTTGGGYTFLGYYSSPEHARAAVLEAQAAHLEQKAAGYRRQAEHLVHTAREEFAP
jgi:hypothetical protein